MAAPDVHCNTLIRRTNEEPHAVTCMKAVEAEITDLRSHLALRYEKRPIEVAPDAIAIFDAVVDRALVGEAARLKSRKCLRRPYGRQIEEGNRASTFFAIGLQL